MHQPSLHAEVAHGGEVGLNQDFDAILLRLGIQSPGGIAEVIMRSSAGGNQEKMPSKCPLLMTLTLTPLHEVLALCLSPSML